MTNPLTIATESPKAEIGQRDFPADQCKQETQSHLVDHGRGDQERKSDPKRHAGADEADEQRHSRARAERRQDSKSGSGDVADALGTARQHGAGLLRREEAAHDAHGKHDQGEKQKHFRRIVDEEGEGLAEVALALYRQQRDDPFRERDELRVEQGPEDEARHGGSKPLPDRIAPGARLARQGFDRHLAPPFRPPGPFSPALDETPAQAACGPSRAGRRPTGQRPPHPPPPAPTPACRARVNRAPTGHHAGRATTPHHALWPDGARLWVAADQGQRPVRRRRARVSPAIRARHRSRMGSARVAKIVVGVCMRKGRASLVYATSRIYENTNMPQAKA